MALWSGVRNPFAASPVRYASYEYLAEGTGLAVSSIEKITRKLQRAGCLRKDGAAPGRGTRYVLLRPLHTADDAKRNPFDPSVSEEAKAEIVAELRGDGCIGKPEAKPKQVKKPAAKPSAVAQVTGELLTVHDIAERLGTNSANVRNMRLRGQLPAAIKLGKRVRWLESDITEWLRNLPRT